MFFVHLLLAFVHPHQVSLILFSRDRSRIQIQKTPMIPDLYLRRQVNPPRYASFSLPSELDAASGFEFRLALVSGFPVVL